MSQDKLDLKKLGIDSSVVADVKKMLRKISRVNNEIIDLSDESENDAQELRKIREQKKALTAKLTLQEKEIKAKRKTRNEKRLMLLGERRAYKNELKELGVNDTAQSLGALPEKVAKELVETEC